MTQDLPPSTIGMHASTRAVCYITTKISYTSKYLTCRPGKLKDACKVKHPEGRKLLASLKTATSSHFPAGDATLKYEISMMAS